VTTITLRSEYLTDTSCLKDVFLCLSLYLSP
jgi:hypothetical protein